MKQAPFSFGTTVSGRSFTDREEESARLTRNLLGGINTCLISPRRWGKSSLVERVANEINRKEKKVKVVVLDLFTAANEAEFLQMYAREVIKASSPRWQDWITASRAFFGALVPKISVGLDPKTDFSLSFDWQELKQNLEEPLNLPEVIAEKKGLRFIICLDEFQNMAGFKDYAELEKKMRAVWQRQKQVTYCLYGSKRHMLNDIFNNPAKPFYRFGDMMELQKIPAEKWTTYIVQGFSDAGKKISAEIAMLIATIMKNHSWYVQQLAHYAWNKTTTTATVADVDAALTELLQANTPFCQREAEDLSATQLNLLKAILKGEQKLTSAKVMKEYNLGTPRNVSKARQALVNKDIIYETTQGFELLDPVFELWFRKQYFNEQIGLKHAQS